MTLDMTHGKPVRLLIQFALPLMLSSLLQQFYTMFDSVIVGRLLGTEAFAAIGSASYLHWFPLSMLLGATHGFGVALSQRFGAKDTDGFRRFLACAVGLTLLIGLLFTAAGVGLLRGLLELINTPPELLELTFHYMRALWLGLLATAILNVFTATLRAMGDSRTPFVSLVVSTVLNIVLDFVFIAWMGMGVEGAALATVLSQGAAALWCFAGVRRTGLLPARTHWRPQASIVRELLRLGVPPLVSHGVTATGDLAVLTAINRFGVLFVTGTTASRRYFSLFNIAGNALEGSLATFVGQNWGAREKQRIRRGARTAFRMGIGSAIVITLLIIAFAQPLILLFLPDGAGESLQVGIDSLRVEVLFLIALYMLLMHRAAIQGMGNAVVPMLSGFLELVMRVLSSWMLPMWVGREGLYFVDAVTWMVTAAMLIACYHVIARRKLNE